MKVIKSYSIRNCSSELTSFILRRLKVDDSKYVGSRLKDKSYNVALFCEDISNCILSFGTGFVYDDYPEALKMFLKDIMYSFDGGDDLQVSSFVIEEKFGNIVCSVTFPKVGEDYSFYFNKDTLKYKGFGVSSIHWLSGEGESELYFDELESCTMERHLKDVISFLKDSKIPIRRVAVYSRRSSVPFNEAAPCIKGIGGVNGYTSLEDVYYENVSADSVFNVDEGEYDLCFLVI